MCSFQFIGYLVEIVQELTTRNESWKWVWQHHLIDRYYYPNLAEERRPRSDSDDLADLDLHPARYRPEFLINFLYWSLGVPALRAIQEEIWLQNQLFNMQFHIAMEHLHNLLHEKRYPLSTRPWPPNKPDVAPWRPEEIQIPMPIHEAAVARIHAHHVLEQWYDRNEMCLVEQRQGSFDADYMRDNLGEAKGACYIGPRGKNAYVARLRQQKGP